MTNPPTPQGSAADEERRRERRRQRPMAGCVRRLGCGLAVFVVLVLILAGGGWYYIGTGSFARLVRARIEQNLESRLGREVTIGRLIVHRGDLGRILIRDLTIANPPEATREHFVYVREIEIVGGIESFWTRTIELGRVDVRDARLNVEIFAEGSRLAHNFPAWRRTPPRRFQITRLEIAKLFVDDAAVELLDRRHDFEILATGIDSEVDPTFQKQIYVGTATSPSVVLQFQDYEPVDLAMRTRYEYRPGVLRLHPGSFRGRGMEIVVQGTVDPLTEAVYQFDIAARTRMERIREIFRLEPELAGLLSFDGGIRGEKGEFSLEGGFVVPELVADAYELEDFRGHLVATEEQTRVRIDSAGYGGGSLEGDYLLSQYREPYPMSVDLRFDGVSIEKLFGDWDVENTGLRGSATGTLAYQWEKDDILGGSGRGQARLAPGAVAFGQARYPLPVSGATTFALDAGTVRFGPSTLRTPRSVVEFRGPLRIEGLVADLDVTIRSEDFSELDRVAYNFAHALDNPEFELLGLGGSGTIVGTVEGPFDAARVAANVVASGFRYNEVLLGEANIDLRWIGPEDTLRFEPAIFSDSGGTVRLTGAVYLPERGPSPRFDLVAEIDGYPVERIIEVVELDLVLSGSASGTAIVQGTPDRGEVTFRNAAVVKGAQRIALEGVVGWEPGEGNVRFDLDVGATAVPVGELLAFLDLGDIPVTGELTGTLHIEGPKDLLEGAGAVTIRNGTIFGEPVEVATADIGFHEGVMTARAVEVRSAAGVLRGEATVNLADETFSYTIEQTELDVSQISLLSALSGILQGRVRISSTGAGSFDRPDLLIEAELLDSGIPGQIPDGVEPPRLYIAMRGGQLRIIGSAWDALSVEGTGTIAENGDLEGEIVAEAADVGALMRLLAPQAELQIAGRAVIRVDLGGNVENLEDLSIEGTVPELQLQVGGRDVGPVEPIRFALVDGTIQIPSMRLRTDGSEFSLAGSVGLTGEKRLNLRVDGVMQAAIFQLLMPDTRLDGQMNLAASIGGTLDEPRIEGTAEVLDADVRPPGFQLIHDITGTLLFTGDRITIDSLTASTGGGRIIAGGFIAVDGLTPTRFRVNLQGTDLSLRYFEGLTVNGDFDLILSGDPERSLLEGTVVVDRALYYRDFDVTSSFLNLFLDRRVVTPEVAASWQDNVALEIDVVADDTLAVRNNIADLTAEAILEVSGTLANPNILGTVTLEEGGTIEFQEVEYRIVRGSVSFQNPFRIDPYIDITAEGRRGEYDLTVNLTGTLEQIQPTITSDPPTSDLTLLSLLSPQLADPTRADASRFELENLTQAGGSLLLQSVGELIGSRIFPFADAFRLDTGALAEISEPKVTFEKRVSDEVRAILVYFLDSEENVIIAEWQVTPDWMLQFVSDSREESDFLVDTVDARFRRRYQGHWFSTKDRSEAVVRADLPVVDRPPPAPTPPSPLIEPLTESESRPVVAGIEFEAEAAVNEERLAAIVSGVRVGQPLSIRDLQAAIKSLYATGEFGDVRVDAYPAEPEGIHLRFLLYLNYKIGQIRFEGLPISRDRVARDLVVASGATFSLNAVDRSATAVAAELQRRGWIEATVDPEIEFTRGANRADITFFVEPGPQARVAAIEFEGDLGPFSETELIARMRMQPGRVYSGTTARADAERLNDFMVRNGRRRALARFLERVYDEESNTVNVRYRVEAGPPVEVRVEGVEARSIRRLLPFRDDDEPYSEDLVFRSADAIRTWYQRRGWYFAEIDVEESLEDGTWVITYFVEPGDRYELAEVVFEGNEQLDDDRLRAAVNVAPSGGFRRFLRTLFRRPGGVTDEVLIEDAESLESLYRLEGFTQIDAGRPVVTRIGEDRIQVTFPIDEGPRTIVTNLVVEGVEQVESAALPDLDLEPGEPLNPQVVVEDLSKLRAFYGDRGNVEVQVRPQFTFNEDRTGAVVTYRVAEGPRVDVEQVVVTGNTYTDSDVILRQARLETGEPFSYRSVLQAQRELYRLGIFQRVNVDAEAAGASVSGRNVVISVEEGRALTIGGSIAYSDAQGAGGSFSLSHRNLLGTARFLGLEARYFEREQRYLLTYREPFVLDWDIPVQLTVFQSHEEETNAQGDISAEFERIGTFVEASRVLGETVRWSARYEYRRVDCFDRTDEARCGSPDAPLDEREVTVSSITPTVFWDRRDDPLNPFRGVFASASLEYAFPLFAAETTFLKGFTQGAWYQPITERSTLSFSARLGLTHRLEETGAGSIVPFPERFTGGGESSHRAFEFDRLGILCADDDFDCEPTLTEFEGDIYPLGGNALILGNVEYRFPLFGSLQGALFVDAGNVWRNIDSIDFDQVRYGAGAGIRYLTPIGPIRFDVGWKLDREPWEDPYVTFLTIGFPY